MTEEQIAKLKEQIAKAKADLLKEIQACDGDPEKLGNLITVYYGMGFGAGQQYVVRLYQGVLKNHLERLQNAKISKSG